MKTNRDCGHHETGGLEDLARYPSRRSFLNHVGNGFGAMALAGLMYPELTKEANAQSAGGMLAPKEPHFPGKAKRAVHIYQSGAQSHLDTWDYKPELANAGGTSTGGNRGRKLLAPQFAFSPQGQSGVMMSEIWPELSKHADDLAIINSMHTDVPAHGPATLLQTTGDFRLPKPSLGSWVVYGLGTDNQNLPAFVAMNPGGFPGQGAKNWQSAFMPGAFQGTFVDPTATDIERIIENIRNKFTTAQDQRNQLDLLNKINEIHKQSRQVEDKLEARIQSYELAYRMQADATEAFDVSREPASVIEKYGANGQDPALRSQARQFIIARRLLERGVRFVQVWNGGWDTHNNIPVSVARNAGRIDQPIAAFLSDLKERGLFEETVIASSTEFGRSPTEDGPNGRSHNNRAFSSWLAGGGIKGGQIYGSTDELGGAAADDRVHVHELHSTILHALGFDSERLTYRNSGRDFRLTDVSGAQPVTKLFS